jgi:subfamily B ATP-binding cassette protein MsbA
VCDKISLPRNEYRHAGHYATEYSLSNTSAGSAKPLGVYRRLLSYVNPYRWSLAMAILAMIVYAASSPAFAALMKPMLDGSFVERDMQAITYVPVLIVVIFIFRGLAGFFSTFLMAKIGWSIVKQIRRELFDKYLDMPTATFDHSSAGDMISRVTFNVRNMAVVATDCLTILVRDSLTIIGLLCLMLYHSWKLSLGFLILGPLVALIVKFVSRRFRKLNYGIQDSMGRVASVIEEAVEGQRLVKVFGGREYERQHFETANETNRSLNVKETFTRAASAPVIQFLVAIALAIIVFLASSGRFVGEISVGVFMSFITAMMMLFAPIKQLTLVNAKIQAGVAAGQSVFEVLDSNSERDTGTAELNSKKIEVAFESVDFSYSNGKPVLENLNFAVAAGETVALVGGSGSGKSTIANLLPRLYDVSSGCIAINNTDIREYTLASLRSHISYVGQEVTLFNDTVMANIAYGKMQGADAAAVEAACRAAHAHEFIEKLSDGYQTVVGENGVMLSGGQRQRIAIARAILKDAPLLVLDEATSALDTESERKVQQGLAELMQNRSTIVIAHRLSTIENADRIIVMDAGRIVEIGTHQQLLKSGGYYAYLQGSQEQPGADTAV